MTRAANVFKSASDEQDWKPKARALESMGAALQRARKDDAGVDRP